MANTLVEYEKLTTDAVKKGIAQTIYQESPWLRYLPFIPCPSNSMKYKMEVEPGGVESYQVGDTWIESTPTWEDRYADLTIIGGDADVDNFAVAAMQVEAADIIALKAKALAQYFESRAVLGGTTTDEDYNAAKVMKGLLKLIAECESADTTDLDGVNNSQVYAVSATSATVSLDDFDALVDRVRPKPTHLIVNRNMRRKLASLARASGSGIQVDLDQMGLPVTRWGEQIILLDDATPNNLPDNTTSVNAIASYDPATARGAGNDNSPVFAVRLAEDGLCGITSAVDGMIQTEEVGQLENKDATRTRIKFYCGLALFSKLAAAVMTGATDNSS